jgi:hypothetical protein
MNNIDIENMEIRAEQAAELASQAAQNVLDNFYGEIATVDEWRARFEMAFLESIEDCAEELELDFDGDRGA